MIYIDGSFGEGGGQILRTAITLGSITKKPFIIKNIRVNRQNPGLQPQHLTACESARKVCRGELLGAELGSQMLEFHPGEIVGGDYEIDIQTAGSSILVAQTLIPILLFSTKKSSLIIQGGTHLPKSPNFDYFENVFLPAISLFGVKIKAQCERPGFYPKGGGILKIELEPTKLTGQTNWKNEAESRGIIRLCSLPSHIALREKAILLEKGIAKIRIFEEPAYSPGNAVTLFKGFIGSSSLGERGKRAEIVAEEAFCEFEKEKGDVDQHLADQLLLYACLAADPSRYTTTFQTEHLNTNAFVIRHFLDRKILVEKNEELTLIDIF